MAFCSGYKKLGCLDPNNDKAMTLYRYIEDINVCLYIYICTIVYINICICKYIIAWHISGILTMSIYFPALFPPKKNLSPTYCQNHPKQIQSEHPALFIWFFQLLIMPQIYGSICWIYNPPTHDVFFFGMPLFKICNKLWWCLLLGSILRLEHSSFIP